MHTRHKVFFTLAGLAILFATVIYVVHHGTIDSFDGFMILLAACSTIIVVSIFTATDVANVETVTKDEEESEGESEEEIDEDDAPRLESERRRTAFHEAGHIVVAWFSEHGPAIHGASIDVDEDGDGIGEVLDDSDIGCKTKTQILANITALLGGKSCEELVFGQFDSGCEDDLCTATKAARWMITGLGMSEKFGVRTYDLSEPGLSQGMLDAINAEILSIVSTQAALAKSILEAHRDAVNLVANALLKEESLDADDIETLLGPPRQNTASDSQG